MSLYKLMYIHKQHNRLEQKGFSAKTLKTMRNRVKSLPRFSPWVVVDVNTGKAVETSENLPEILRMYK